jgi:hypothetical protein
MDISFFTSAVEGINWQSPPEKVLFCNENNIGVRQILAFLSMLQQMSVNQTAVIPGSAGIRSTVFPLNLNIIFSPLGILCIRIQSNTSASEIGQILLGADPYHL